MKNYEQLTDKELLSIIVSERKDEEVVDKLFNKFTTLPNMLMNTTETMLQNISGIGSKRAAQLKCLTELIRRVNQINLSDGYHVSGSNAAIKLLQSDTRLKFEKQEHFLVILLNTKNKVIGIETITKGTLTASLVSPREVFRLAIQHSCKSIIIAHNHPSGDPYPSGEDKNVTKILKDAGDILDIKVLDHIIVGSPDCFSFADNGLM